ncbi:hypothetical protein [Lacticaseibacillus camelliae]|nr:hypothetical protein [Lacticaseibacillus camelliae]
MLAFGTFIVPQLFFALSPLLLVKYRT